MSFSTVSTRCGHVRLGGNENEDPDSALQRHPQDEACQGGRGGHINCAAVRFGDLGRDVKAEAQSLLGRPHNRSIVAGGIATPALQTASLNSSTVFAVTVTGSPSTPYVNALPNRLQKSCPIRTASARTVLGQREVGLDD